MTITKFLFTTIIPVLFLYGSVKGQTTLVNPGADWKYLDDGSDQGTSWREVGFNDTLWTAGPAQLGYGDGDEATII
ncbi:MAG: hypothetical protein GQ565_02495, partial [Candidatus Aegiribacteria sp.]|nr:hypothetical protein [Candidatus Aegiribacteria sp.]